MINTFKLPGSLLLMQILQRKRERKRGGKMGKRIKETKKTATASKSSRHKTEKQIMSEGLDAVKINILGSSEG
jgi:hypothetical protein